jgi:chromosome segregation ATPase
MSPKKPVARGADPKQTTPLVDPTPQLADVAKAVQALSKDLERTLAAATAEAVKGELRGGLATELQRSVDQRVSDARAELMQRVEAAAKEGAVRDASIRALVTEVREALGQASAKVEALSEDTLATRIGGAVSAATRDAAIDVYRQEFARKLEQLEAAFDDAEGGFDRLKAWVESYGPGGLPVLQQQLEQRAAQVADLETQLEELRGKLHTRTEALTKLESERTRERALQGIDPADLRRKLDEIDALSRDLSERESLTSRVQQLEHDLDSARNELRAWTKRDREVQEYESNASLVEQLREDIQRFELQLDEVEQRRARAESERNRARSEARRLDEELTRLEADRAAAEQRDARLAELTDQLGDTKANHEDARRTIAELERELDEVRISRQELSLKLGEAEEQLRQAQLAWKAEHAQEHRDVLDADRLRLESWAENTAASRSAEHIAEAARVNLRVGQLEDRVHELEGQLANARSELALARAAQAEAEATSEGLQRDFERRQGLLDREHQEALVRLKETLDAEAERVRAEARKAGEAEAETARQKAEEYRAESERFGKLLDQVESQHEELSAAVTELQGTKGVLEGELEVLRDQIAELRTKAVPEEQRLAQLHRAWFAADQLPEPGDIPTSERAWLDGLGQRITKAGFSFHPRLLRAFHTSLKIARDAPLTMLAGISGTGKSELPRLYAELGGLPFMELAVQPSWDSPHDLFGFFNYTDGRLKAEPLARLLWQIAHDEALQAGPMVVLLDEMNLARVEYYFAELLSKLEARRSALRAGTDDARRRASVLLDAGPGEADLALFLDERVLFVGTMNEDESTLTLSDKVLDRSCVLTFPAPRNMSLGEQIDRSILKGPRLDLETWKRWQADALQGDIADRLNEVNRRMEELARPFGHRLFRAIHAYVANYPGGGEQGPDDAWSDQFAMKIMPRLRGLECGDRAIQPQLRELRNLVPEDLRDAFDRACSREFFAWEGAASLYQVEG